MSNCQYLWIDGCLTGLQSAQIIDMRAASGAVKLRR